MVHAEKFLMAEGSNEILEDSVIVEHNTTNNRMEMKAVISAYEAFAAKYGNIPVQIYTDSAYIHNCMSEEWYKMWAKNGWVNSQKEPVKNKDLWEQIIPLFQNNKIEFKKVKGHVNNFGNNYVDGLAQVATSKEKMKKGRITNED